MEHRSVRLWGLFGAPASVRKGGKMKKRKNKKVETLGVSLHVYTRAHLHKCNAHIHTYIFTSSRE